MRHSLLRENIQATLLSQCSGWWIKMSWTGQHITYTVYVLINLAEYIILLHLFHLFNSTDSFHKCDLYLTNVFFNQIRRNYCSMLPYLDNKVPA